MGNKVGQQSDIIENIKETIASAEEERKALRFKHNLNELVQGRIQVLKNDEFVEDLGRYFGANSQRYSDKENDILRGLGEGALFDEIPLRERALSVISHATEYYFGLKNRENILILVDIYNSWLEFETEFLPGFAVINRRFEEIFEWLLQESCWKEMEKTLLLLSRIHSGGLHKNAAVRSLVSKTMEKLAKKTTIEKLTDEYLLEGDLQGIIKSILVLLGPKCLICQLNRVIHSHSRKERLVLLDLIPAFGETAIPVLVDCLEKNPPWAVVRNVIYIISAIGLDKNYPLVEQYFQHQDERVQHEMICCVMKLDVQARVQRLIEALRVVNSRLKTYIIQLFVEQEMKDEAVLETLCDLIQNSNKFSDHNGLEVLSAAITGLKAFPCSRSLELLVELRAEYEKEVGSEQLILHLDEALMAIKPKVRHSLQSSGSYDEVVSFASDPMEKQLAFGKVQKIEEEILALVGAGNTKQAAQLVYAQAVIAAQEKNFSVADMLRDRLLEINPLALSEVVQLGELIEEQKSSLITSHHIEIWNELYEEMTTDEFNALYYSLRQENYRKGDIIINSGETDNNLYFLNSGYISLSCISGGKEIFLRRMQPSDVLGGEQFFSASVWTVSLKALSEVQVQVLGDSALEKIIVDHPGVETALRKYCLKYTKIPELLKMSGDDRREYPRYPGTLVTRSILLDPYGNKGKRSFKGELIDVSQGGLAFIIRISNKNNARLLLGRQILTSITVDGEELPQCNGVIVGVRIHDAILQDFSVHVKLSKKMNDESFRKIISLAG